MNFIEKLQVIERVDGLIRRKATGSAQELADRLGVSRRCVYDIIEVMKTMGALIEYDQQRKTFYYSEMCELSIGFVPKGKIRGGEKNIEDFFICADFLHNPTLPLS